MFSYSMIARNQHLVERMDDPDSSLLLLENTYRQFVVINTVLTGWRKLYRARIKPVLEQSPAPTLLDIGFGGGDLAYSFRKWAKHDGIDLQITAIDSDPRALRFVDKKYGKIDSITFKNATLQALNDAGDIFDVVISNHVLHHLSDQQLAPFLASSKAVAKSLVIHNDLRRSRLAYSLFYFSKYFFKNSFIYQDGRISILRAFSKAELKGATNNAWEIEEAPPFRLIAQCRVPSAEYRIE